MRSLKRRFEIKAKKYFGYSNYLIFCETVKGQTFSEKTIRYWFGKLISKNDYGRNTKKSLIFKLLELNKSTDEGIK